MIHGEVEKDTEEVDSLLPHQTLPGRIGTGILDFSVKIPNLSSVTGVLSGAYKNKTEEVESYVFLAYPTVTTKSNNQTGSQVQV